MEPISKVRPATTGVMNKMPGRFTIRANRGRSMGENTTMKVTHKGLVSAAVTASAVNTSAVASPTIG